MKVKIAGVLCGLLIIRQLWMIWLPSQYISPSWINLLGITVICLIGIDYAFEKWDLKSSNWVGFGLAYLLINLLFMRIMGILELDVPMGILDKVYYLIFYPTVLIGIIKAVKMNERLFFILATIFQIAGDLLYVLNMTKLTNWIDYTSMILYLSAIFLYVLGLYFAREKVIS
ncbi:MAG: hypothetical protein WCG44_04645 [bacterium]